MGNYLAFDLGASSGRGLLGKLRKGVLQLEEVSRFPNRPVKLNGHLHWDIVGIYQRLLEAMQALAERGEKVDSIGVDTWGVDFGLIARDGSLVGVPYAYRDARTDGAPERAFKRLSWERLYEITGIQLMPINSVFQLFVMAEAKHPWLEIADRLLFLPDLLNYLMTGKVVSELTIASTSQMLDARQRTWSREIFDALGLPFEIMPEIVGAGHSLGELAREIQEETGLSVGQVVATAGHDTASAVAAVPAQGGNWAYLSSGTWSLMGVELDEPLLTAKARDYNFTNEAGVAGKIRFLKNISGLWILQECRREWGETHSWAELTELASQAEPFVCQIFPDDPEFLKPGDMPAKVKNFCRRTGQRVPETVGQIVRVVLESLALRYKSVFASLQEVLGQKIETVHIVGGGSQNRLLDQFTASALGVRTTAGPAEATACGNMLVQAMTFGEIDGLSGIREVVRKSFEIETFEPQNEEDWEEAFERYREIEAEYE